MLEMFWKLLQNHHVLLTFGKVRNPLRTPRKKNASSLPKTGPRPSLFYTFHFQMCFAPQRCALFRHLDFQKCSENGVFCKFYLGNVATTAYVFSSSQLPKVLRSCCVLYMLTWKCASRHNGVHFFDIATSKSAPRMMCFVRLGFEICFEPQLCAIFHLISPDGSAPAASASLLFDTFRPFVAPKHWQNTVIRDFSAFFARLYLLSSDSFSSLIFLLLLFSSLL